MKATLVAIVAAGFCLAGCSDISTQVGGIPASEISSEPTPKPASQETMSLPTYTEDDSSITARVGETFVIKLESNLTTGYSWELSEDYSKSILELVGSEYQSPKVQRPGAGGHEVWQFKAVGSGTTQIQLQYRRPWEEEAAPAKTKTFGIEVSED